MRKEELKELLVKKFKKFQAAVEDFFSGRSKFLAAAKEQKDTTAADSIETLYQKTLTPETAARPCIIAGMIIVGIFFGGFGLWAVLGKMEGAVVAPGVIKVEQNRKDIQHLEGGIVQKIWVRDGDKVVKGQKLISLQGISINSNVDILSGQLNASLAMKARLEAERKMANAISWPDELMQNQDEANTQRLMRMETEVFNSQRNTLREQEKLLKTQVEQIYKQIDGLTERSASEDNIIAALEDELVAKRELLRERFLDKPQVLALERELASHRGLKSSLAGQMAESQERITEIRVRLNALKTQYVERAVNQMAQLQPHLFDLQDRIRPLLDAQVRLDIVSPTTGTVVGMQVFSEGGVVRPGEVLMQIVPEKEPLIVECHVRPMDIAKVFMGQQARIQLNAFNQREVQPVGGTVVYLSADSVDMRTPYGEQQVYQAHVEIEVEQVIAQGVEISPGMPVTVFFSTGKRSFLDYIMEPLIENFRQALNE